MTDLDMTRMCAEAMGFDYVIDYDIVDNKERSWINIAKGAYPTGPYGQPSPEKRYDPLHDDAQAMALVKKLELCIFNDEFHTLTTATSTGRRVLEWIVYYDGCLEKDRIKGFDLNRAIVECVSKMQNNDNS